MMTTIHILIFTLASTTYALSDATQTCNKLTDAIPGFVFGPNDPQYKTEQARYWNIGLNSDQPTCIVLPDSAEKVSTAIKILGIDSAVRFAVKSGGHDPNPNHSAINGGVLIALSHLNGTTYDEARNVAYVKPGGTWSDVLHALQPSGVAVVGGRLGVVGIGGYLLGGGLSFLSAQYGLACDSIVEMETVLPNGTITSINAQSNNEIFTAMKGSGNQFGVVTKFTLRTYPIGQVWGGYRIYDSSQQNALLSTLHDFIENPTDPKAAIICDANNRQGFNFFQVFYFYDGPTPPSGAFKDFLSIPSLLDETKVWAYPDLLDFNGQGADSQGTRASFRSITLPLIPGNPGIAFLNKIIQDWQNITSPYFSTHNTSTAALAFQVFPASIGVASAAAGGNALGLSSSDKPRYILELSDLWGNATDSSQDATIYLLSALVTGAIQEQMVPFWENSTAELEGYNPFFMNDAAFDQGVLQSYQNYSDFRALQRANDPNGMFSWRVGGFKY